MLVVQDVAASVEQASECARDRVHLARAHRQSQRQAQDQKDARGDEEEAQAGTLVDLGFLHRARSGGGATFLALLLGLVFLWVFATGTVTL